MKKRYIGAAGAAGLLGIPLLWGSKLQSEGPGPCRDLDDAVQLARESGLAGLELVAWTARLVHDQYEWQTRRFPFLTVAQSFQRRIGSSVQYNGALAEVLRRLGFDAELIFAARVRRGTALPPWYAMGHAWVRVVVDRRSYQLCARFGPLEADAIRRAEMSITPVTDVHRIRRITEIDHAILASWLTAAAQWDQWVAKKPFPWWLESRF